MILIYGGLLEWLFQNNLYFGILLLLITPIRYYDYKAF